MVSVSVAGAFIDHVDPPFTLRYTPTLYTLAAITLPSLLTATPPTCPVAEMALPQLVPPLVDTYSAAAGVGPESLSEVAPSTFVHVASHATAMMFAGVVMAATVLPPSVDLYRLNVL